MKLSLLFTALNQLRVDHWQTKSHAEHTALGSAYDALDGLFDELVEKFYGREEIPTEQVTYSMKVDSYRGNLIPRCTKLRDVVMEYLATVTADRGDLKNLQDDVEGEFNHLLYKLQQK